MKFRRKPNFDHHVAIMVSGLTYTVADPEMTVEEVRSRVANRQDIFVIGKNLTIHKCRFYNVDVISVKA